MMMVDDVKDIVTNLKRLESTTYNTRQRRTTVASNAGAANNDVLFRNVIIQWMYNVADIFDINYRVVAVATWYVDEAVHITQQHSNNNNNSDIVLVQTPTDYQLVSLTALYMSMKLYTL